MRVRLEVKVRSRFECGRRSGLGLWVWKRMEITSGVRVRHHEYLQRRGRDVAVVEQQIFELRHAELDHLLSHGLLFSLLGLRLFRIRLRDVIEARV